MIKIMNQMTIFWIFIAIVMGVVEASTMSLVSVWFCLGAIAAMITAIITPSVFIQSVVFVIVTAVSLVATKPLVKKVTKGEFTPTNADRIIGREAIVTQTIDPIKGAGQVSIGGQIWSAKNEHSTEIKEKTIVIVTKISGVHAIVRPKEEE